MAENLFFYKTFQNESFKETIAKGFTVELLQQMNSTHKHSCQGPCQEHFLIKTYSLKKLVPF